MYTYIFSFMCISCINYNVLLIIFHVLSESRILIINNNSYSVVHVHSLPSEHESLITYLLDGCIIILLENFYSNHSI